MKLNGKSGFALFLIGCGALILLGKLGGVIGGLMSFLFPLALAALGYYGIKHGRSFIGWILLIIGCFGLMVKLSGLIGLLIAIAFVFYGISLLRNTNSNSHQEV